MPEKLLPDTGVEVPLPGGLDTLVAGTDGQIRYLNQAGKLAVFNDGTPSVTGAAGSLAASAPVVACIGPRRARACGRPSRAGCA